MATIPVRREDNSEIIPYNFDKEGYYVFLGIEKLSDHPNNIMLTHWHNDVEIMIPLKGHMKCNVNGEIIDLDPHTGIFINSQQIHYCFSSDHGDCEFIYLLWHPMLLCATGGIEENYITPVLKNSSIPFIYLTTEIKWKNDVLSIVYETLNNLGSAVAPLLLQSCLYRIWALVFENTRGFSNEKHAVSTQLSTMKDMLDYIQKNYGSKVYLQDIAEAGNVSASCCSNIFKKYVRVSPVKYLLNYRLMKSCDLLKTTECSVTQIAYECGFSNVSYYNDAFRRNYSCTPLEFRKKSQLDA